MSLSAAAVGVVGTVGNSVVLGIALDIRQTRVPEFERAKLTLLLHE